MKKDTILIVDDEETILKMLADNFQSQGYEVLTASSAADALEQLEGRRVEMVLTDLRMPGTTGIELCETIRQTNSISIVIAMTAYCSLFEVQEARAAGFDDYLKKPIDLLEINDIVADAMARVRRWLKK